MSLCDLRWVAIEVATSQNPRNEGPLPAADQPNLANEEPQDTPGGVRRTREVGIRELKHRTSEVIDRVAQGERVAVTRRGRIVAVILSLDESLEFVLGYAEDFTRARAEATESTDAG